MLNSKDPYFDSTNIFGAADIGIVGYETPLSILVRRGFNQNPVIAAELFGTEILPSLVQFDPTKRHFEKVNEELVVTSNSGIPLVRYNLKDTGGILSREDITMSIADWMEKNADEAGVEIDMNDLPFVYLNGRKNFMVSLYGVNIYPENIKAGLLDARVCHFVTGRFTMAVKTDDAMNQSFEVNVELAKNADGTMSDQEMVSEVVLEALTQKNSEFRKLYDAVDTKAKPQIRLVEFGDQNYFARGVKHRWTKKEDTK
jgi:phenylacetate-CoA ligase